jgi:hypothetical protein
MSDVQKLLFQCEQLGAELIPTDHGTLKIRSPEPLPEALREELKRRKPELLRLLSRPYLTDTGELRIPFTADRRYHWWNGGQSLAETLSELNAPPDVWRRYVVDYTETRQ